MELAPQSQNPNLANPNWDPQLSYISNQLNDPTYSYITNYLMSDVEDCFEEKSEKVSKDFTDYSQEFSSVDLFSSNMKNGRGRLKKYKTQDDFRFAFRTKTDLEFLDDGYKWRKYGKKMIKNNRHPRNYFKCSSSGCMVKKRVERDSEDPSYVITTYQGIHNHQSPTCVLYTSPQPPSLLPISSSII